MLEKSGKFLIRMRKPAFIGILLLLNCFGLRNFFLLSSDMLYGDHSADRVVPPPTFPSFRVPVEPIARTHHAVGRIASDFAPIYFPAQALSQLQRAYIVKTFDPWRRPTILAPLLILVCAQTLCRFDYGYASLLHMLIQLLLSYGILYWGFWHFGIRRYFLPCLLLANICLFLTPAGLSWFERGQFSLYIAISYALLVPALIKNNPLLIAGAAVFAFLKWTSFPPVFVILAVYLLASRTFPELKSHAIIVAIFGSVIAGMLLLPALFTHGTGAFLKGLMFQEFEDSPKGISLLLYVPRVVVKLLPVGLILLGYVNVRANKGGFEALVPYIAGVATLMLVYPTMAFDYGVPSLLGFLPALLSWAQLSESSGNMQRRILVYAFFLFILTISFSTRLIPSPPLEVGIYVAFSFVLMLSPFVLAKYRSVTGSPALGAQNMAG